MNYEFSGTITQVDEPRTGVSQKGKDWIMCNFCVKSSAEDVELNFTTFGEFNVNQLKKDAAITLEFTIRGNRSVKDPSKLYNSLSVSKIFVHGLQNQQTYQQGYKQPQQQYQQQTQQPQQQTNDDLPF